MGLKDQGFCIEDLEDGSLMRSDIWGDEFAGGLLVTCMLGTVGALCLYRGSHASELLKNGFFQRKLQGSLS